METWPPGGIVNRLPMRHRLLMTLYQWLCLALADVVLMIHAAFVTFVFIGLMLIWIGRFRGWAFVRHFWFRAAHLAAIGVVAAESLLGFVCPLTRWEDRLRLLAGGRQRYAGSFIEHWLHRLIFFDFDPRDFTIAYVSFLLAVAVTFWLIPPRWPRRRRGE
jgi:Protein of Unknown function (DUF2784)